MHILTSQREKVELVPVQTELEVEAGQVLVRAAGMAESTGRLSRAVRTFFAVPTGPRLPTAARMVANIVRQEPPMALFREKESGLVRIVHKEIVLRFAADVPPRKRNQFLLDRGLEVRASNPFIPNQFIVKVKNENETGEALLDIANKCMQEEEVVFATPNFISEYRRRAIPAIPVAQWHLKNTKAVAGQKLNEDVKAKAAWAVTMGKPSIVVAVLDDGVDVDHPNLKSNILKNPDPTQPLDLVGRDFFIPDNTNVEHFNPRPKLFQFPFDEMQGNDIHGTPCAGVIAGAGKQGGCAGHRAEVSHSRRQDLSCRQPGLRRPRGRCDSLRGPARQRALVFLVWTKQSGH